MEWDGSPVLEFKDERGVTQAYVCHERGGPWHKIHHADALNCRVRSKEKWFAEFHEFADGGEIRDVMPIALAIDVLIQQAR